MRWGVPDPAKPRSGDLPSERVQAANARGGAEVVVLATPHAAAVPALRALGDLTGAIVIDCTNPLAVGPGGLHLTIGYETSGAEEIARAVPGAAVFKALNQTGAENMGEAEAYHPRPVMFVAGDGANQKRIVLDLIDNLGFEAVDAGPLAAARLLEPLATLWIELALKRGHGRDFAFALVRHPKSPLGKSDDGSNGATLQD